MSPSTSPVQEQLAGLGTQRVLRMVGRVPSAANCDQDPDLGYQFSQLHPVEAGLSQTGRFLQVFPESEAVSHWLISSPLPV